MKNIGIKTPPSGIGTTLQECLQIANTIGEFPLISCPAFTLGGSGGGSVTSQVLVEKSLLGWKEYEPALGRKVRQLGHNFWRTLFVG
ncbi:hypothetical protein LXL04_033118 [Taraxacum kok-saghyz]